MNHLVKILSADDGEKRKNTKWCLVVNKCAGNMTLCEGEYFGMGESGCEYEYKTVEKGGITCSDCLAQIKYIKNIKL